MMTNTAESVLQQPGLCLGYYLKLSSAALTGRPLFLVLTGRYHNGWYLCFQKKSKSDSGHGMHASTIST